MAKLPVVIAHVHGPYGECDPAQVMSARERLRGIGDFCGGPFMVHYSEPPPIVIARDRSRSSYKCTGGGCAQVSSARRGPGPFMVVYGEPTPVVIAHAAHMANVIPLQCKFLMPLYSDDEFPFDPVEDRRQTIRLRQEDPDEFSRRRNRQRSEGQTKPMHCACGGTEAGGSGCSSRSLAMCTSMATMVLRAPIPLPRRRRAEPLAVVAILSWNRAPAIAKNDKAHSGIRTSS
ncbi:hypothetical protein GGX14DRAFT_386251 [Mycena pura]|uniref:Uncharacterized protein n=1 Tax=Mycena pura TaxID=153505 RepID=A0AAD7E3D7_9AGAR|nr:hypothetical protein GGX14DRAFT_386251 [Mycena pura]